MNTRPSSEGDGGQPAASAPQQPFVYVVERYVPGLSRPDLVRSLERLERAVAEMAGEGTAVRYLGSTIVPGDEACFCEFEAASADAVAEANRRAGVLFDRIVPAVAVAPRPRLEGGER